MTGKFKLITTLTGLFLVISALSYVDDFGLLNFLRPYIRVAWLGLGWLILLGVIVLGLLGLRRSKDTKNALKKHPDLFKEMHTELNAILLPLGFDEREGDGWASRTKFVEFTRDEYTVSLWLDVLDSIYHVDMSSKSETIYKEKRPLPDSTVECFDLTKADEFKSESIAKLNEWLNNKRVR